MSGKITQQCFCFANVSLAVAHVARAEVAVHGLGALQVRVAGKQVAVQLGIQLIERGAITDGDVIDLVHGFGVLRGGGQQVGLHHIGNKAEVAAGFSVAVDEDGLAFDHAGDPFWDDGGIGAIGVLPGAKHVEIAQADGVKAVAAGKHVGVQLIDIFGDGVGAEGFADCVFHLG